MKAAVLSVFGKPPRCSEFPDPQANEDEVVVHVRAAALKPVDRQLASGSHYASHSNLPMICGTDGVGTLDDGRRVFFAAPRGPFGAMAERAVVAAMRCFPLPDNVDDSTAAAVFNPGLSAFGALKWRAQIAPGETVLVLGATGVTGKLAVQTAKLLGAGRVIAAGRNEKVLNTLQELGADAIIRLDKTGPELSEVFAREAGAKGFDVVIDYLWGPPVEALLGAITRKDFNPASSRVRLVQVGESAGSAISLPAAVLRSSRLEILGAGSGNAPASREAWGEAIQWLLGNVARGAFKIETEQVPLADVESAWGREWHGRRAVIVP
ncbi:MAG TPA: zinc-binding alcohol dehydrogenase family protein [Candidatus Sulfotelmatobacter sp.]|nr:zinc-binding alcohol dehydrogenase family protein [Candidatus Sulfotelmatobacter sp.]